MSAEDKVEDDLISTDDPSSEPGSGDPTGESEQGRADSSPDPAPSGPEEKRAAEEVARDDRIRELEDEIRRRSRRMNLNIGIILLGVAIVAIATYAYWDSLFREENFVIIYFIGFGMLYFIATVYGSGETDTGRLQADLDNLRRQKKVAERLKEYAQPARRGKDEAEPEGPSYFDQLVETNIENLGAYYTLVRHHTDNSFRVTVMAAVVGFILIAVGLAVGFNTGGERELAVYISTGAGVMVEFIAGIFFYLYSRTVRQLKAYHDSLLDVQNILLSFKLIEDSGTAERTEMVGKMLDFLTHRQTGDGETDGPE